MNTQNNALKNENQANENQANENLKNKSLFTTAISMEELEPRLELASKPPRPY